MCASNVKTIKQIIHYVVRDVPFFFKNRQLEHIHLIGPETILQLPTISDWIILCADRSVENYVMYVKWVKMWMIDNICDVGHVTCPILVELYAGTLIDHSWMEMSNSLSTSFHSEKSSRRPWKAFSRALLPFRSFIQVSHRILPDSEKVVTSVDANPSLESSSWVSPITRP